MLKKKSAFKILNIQMYNIQILNKRNLEYTSIQNLDYEILDIYLEAMWSTIMSWHPLRMLDCDLQ